VQKLVERGWAERSGQEGDRRAVRVTLTHAGRRVLYRPRDAAAEALLPRLAALDHDTLGALAAGVQALARVLAADEPTDAPDGDVAS
jgi:DNA-binding MarR family transcriptional regulator